MPAKKRKPDLLKGKHHKKKSDPLKGKNLISIGWEDLEYMAAHMARIVKANMKPDMIIAIGRGGWIAGRMMSSFFGVTMGSILARHYTDPGKMREFFIDSRIVSHKTVKGNIVLVDDVVGTGKTMQEALKLLKRNRKIRKIMTASLYYSTKSEYKPDVFIKQIRPEDWVVFPYEKEAYEGIKF